VGRVQRLRRAHLDVAAEQCAHVVLQRARDLAVQPAAGGDQRHAQQQAGCEDEQRPAAGAQVAPGQVKQEAHACGHRAGWAARWPRPPLAGALVKTAVVQLQHAVAPCAKSRSCVTSTIVEPLSACSSKSRSRTSAPVWSSSVAGRLVGQQHARAVHQRARDSHALLLAAGELARVVIQPGAQAHALQQRTRASHRVACAGDLQR